MCRGETLHRGDRWKVVYERESERVSDCADQMVDSLREWVNYLVTKRASISMGWQTQTRRARYWSRYTTTRRETGREMIDRQAGRER